MPLERWSAGALERWSAGALERWSAVALERWSAVALDREDDGQPDLSGLANVCAAIYRRGEVVAARPSREAWLSPTQRDTRRSSQHQVRRLSRQPDRG
jgi:hypothetical protein